ncbi:MAG: hypothetical protein HYX71_13515 [Opitutae bacterium]|nr:hypothetical protein [Opitutae bacterium]
MKSQFVTPAALAAMSLALSVFSGGCSTTYVVQVDAISQAAKVADSTPVAMPQSYEIRSNNPKMDESSLRYKEVTGYVKTALSGKGMYEAPRAVKADVVVDIDYGMDSPRVKFETISVPIYAPTGGGVRYGQVPVYDRNGRIVGYQTVALREPPRMEVVGYEDRVKPVVVYEKFLKISARANQESVEGRAPPEVWSVNVSAEDESKDLRKYLPILASATADYIGKNTKEQKPVKIKEDDEVVGFIKKGI